MGMPRKRQNQAKTVAVGCDQLPIGAHGKGALPPWYGGGRFPGSAKRSRVPRTRRLAGLGGNLTHGGCVEAVRATTKAPTRIRRDRGTRGRSRARGRGSDGGGGRG